MFGGKDPTNPWDLLKPPHPEFAEKGAVAVQTRLGVAFRERGCTDDPVKIHVALEIHC